MGIMGTWKSHITLKLDVGFVIVCFVDGHLETRKTVSLICTLSESIKSL